jgi:hypothetical protein
MEDKSEINVNNMANNNTGISTKLTGVRIDEGENQSSRKHHGKDKRFEFKVIV